MSNFGTISFKNTDYRIVLPFYVYAAISFLVVTVLMFFSIDAFKGHYFHPHILSITHLMALGWGTMIILGASHQLVPVLIEAPLFSKKLAAISFILAAVGIPMLVYGFYLFQLIWPAEYGACLIVLAVLAFLINIGSSISKSKNENIHALFVFSATGWLFLTVSSGLLFLHNLTNPFLPSDSLRYLPLHAHAGIIGWFLLLVIGVGSRLIPLFLISKYHNTRLLWWIYGLINSALIIFVVLFLYDADKPWFLLPILLISVAVLSFAHFCYQSYAQRIRKQVDNPMRLSLLSVGLLVLPMIFLIVIVIFLIIGASKMNSLVLSYGFLVFFGWITAIILAMTFKTLPFIVWNKAYHKLAGLYKTPNPKDLFDSAVFRWMVISYLCGFVLFVIGVLTSKGWILQSGALLLLATAVFYNWNVFKIVMHKPRLV
ncbi:MAG: cytochrome C oxidase subunit I [Bacteroidetes bacterium]|nr:cytochrome C oxidase subunit I [Bacteroidota bacterium]